MVKLNTYWNKIVKEARAKMFFRMIFKSLKVRRSRVSMAFFSVAIGSAIITALSSVYYDISLKMSRELRAYGANFFIAPKASSKERLINLSLFERVMSEVPRDKMIGASPYIFGMVRVGHGNAVMAGVDFPELIKLSPYWQVEGKWVSVGFDERHCMVGKTLAAGMKLKPGDSVTVSNIETGFNTTFIVRGIMETGQTEDRQIFVNIQPAHRILDIDGKISYAMASITAEGFDIEGFAAVIEKKFPEIDAKPIRKVSYSDGKILDKIKGLMALVSGIILIVTTLCVMTTLIAGVAERTKEIGLMKALGAENRSIVTQFLTETGIIGITGALTGLIAGFILAQIIGRTVFNSFISFRIIILPAALIISTAASLAAAIIPVKMAISVEPAGVLKGE